MKDETTYRLKPAATRVSAVSVAANTALAGIKAIAGLAAGSGALLCDAVHSCADLFSSLIVMLGVYISAREADREHPYGHERFECTAAIALAIILLGTGLFIGLDALETLQSGEAADAPGAAALAAAAASIAIKEALFRYTWFFARRLDSNALRAEAWHHRSDALCSLGVFAGIAGARMGFPALDSVSSLIICLFIAKAAFDIFRDAIQKMVDRSCTPETESALRRCILQQPGVLSVASLRTRQFGNRFCADVSIIVSRHLPLTDGYHIAECVQMAALARFPKLKHIIVCAIPEENDIQPLQ